MFLSLTRKSQLQRQIFTFIKYHTISSHNAFHTILERRLPRPAVVFNNQVCAILVVWFSGNTESLNPPLLHPALRTVERLYPDTALTCKRFGSSMKDLGCLQFSRKIGKIRLKRKWKERWKIPYHLLLPLLLCWTLPLFNGDPDQVLGLRRTSPAFPFNFIQYFEFNMF